MPNPLVGPETSPFSLSVFNTLGAFSGPGRLQKSRITLSANYVQVHTANSTAVATASIRGSYTGTASWSITDASGAFQINSSTGAITVLDVTKISFAQILPVTISVSGTTPTISNLATTIEVIAGGIMYQLLLSP